MLSFVKVWQHADCRDIHTHTRARTRARAHTHTHARTYTASRMSNMFSFLATGIKKYYDIGDTLGKGSFAVVKKGVPKVRGFRS